MPKGEKKSLVLDAALSQPWAILPEKLEEIVSFLHNWAQNGTTIDLDAYQPGDSGYGADDPLYDFDSDTGIATIPILGTIVKRGNMMTRMSGATSIDMLRMQMQAAVEDPAVKGIMLYVDSPGGTVSGTKDLADYIMQARQQKPVVAFTDGNMASAAYWLGSAATEVVASDTAVTGSIGVIYTHADYSKADERDGVKRTNIYAGKYKAVGSDNEPLTKDSKAVIQDMVDTYYAIFVGAVAAQRGVDVAQALAMADGKVYIGAKGKDVGLVDHIGSRDHATQRLVQLLGTSAVLAGYRAAVGIETHTTISEGGTTAMTLEELKTQYPDLYAQVVAVGGNAVRADYDAKFDALKKDTDDRIAALEQQNAQLEKDKAIRDEKDREAAADAIWAEKLAASAIPATLHTKVRSHVKYGAFVKDDALDAEAFGTAVDAEIKSWVEALGDTATATGTPFEEKQVLGQGTMRKTVAANGADKLDASDEALIKRLAGLAGEAD